MGTDFSSMYQEFVLSGVRIIERLYSLVLNKRGVQIVGRCEIFRKSNKRGGPNNRGGDKLGNLYLKIRYKIMFFILYLSLFICFLRQYKLWHTEISQNTLY